MAKPKHPLSCVNPRGPGALFERAFDNALDQEGERKRFERHFLRCTGCREQWRIRNWLLDGVITNRRFRAWLVKLIVLGESRA